MAAVKSARLLVPLALSLAFVLVAPATASAPRAHSSAVTVKASLKNFSIKLTRTKFKARRKGIVVTFNMKNVNHQDDTQHTLRLGAHEADPLDPGTRGTFEVKLKPRKKPYKIYCPIDDHRAGGMVRSLKVSLKH